MKKTTIVMTILLLLATMVVAQTAEVRPEGVPVLVYGQVLVNEQAEDCSWSSRLSTTGDGLTYTITTYDKNTAELITQRSGIVGTLKQGYIFESQNDVNNDGDSVVITVTKGNLTGKITKTISHQENYQSFMDFGILVVKGAVREECEEEPKPKPGELYLHTVKFISKEYLVIGEELITNVMLDNVGESTIEQVKINVLIADLGVRRSIGLVDIDPDDSTNKDIYIEIPEWAEPGDYDVRITVSNDDLRRVVYRIMTVEA
jgi:hypothetical protein